MVSVMADGATAVVIGSRRLLRQEAASYIPIA